MKTIFKIIPLCFTLAFYSCKKDTKEPETTPEPAPASTTGKLKIEFAHLFDFPLGKAVRRESNYAMSNTFGFGGHIASVVMKKV